MEIPLNDEWKLTTDKHNWNVERLETVKAKDKPERQEWRIQGYYASSEQAIRAIPDLLAMSPEVKTLKDLGGVVERFCSAKVLEVLR